MAELKTGATKREYRHIGLRNKDELDNLRSLANDRRQWNTLVSDICGKHNVFAAEM